MSVYTTLEASAICRDPSRIPSGPGFFSFDIDDFAHLVPQTSGPDEVQPSGPTQKDVLCYGAVGRGLRQHVMRHLVGKSVGCPFRKTLAYLLNDQLSLGAFGTEDADFENFPADSEERLTAWMAKHLTVTFRERPAVPYARRSKRMPSGAYSSARRGYPRTCQRPRIAREHGYRI